MGDVAGEDREEAQSAVPDRLARRGIRRALDSLAARTSAGRSCSSASTAARLSSSLLPLARAARWASSAC